MVCGTDREDGLPRALGLLQRIEGVCIQQAWNEIEHA